MSKQTEQQRFIFKIHSSRLAKNKWNLSLPLDEARKNDEVISLASSQMLRWIDKLNGLEQSDSIAVTIKKKIRELKSSGNSSTVKKEIRKLYKQLDEVQFKPDYMCLIIDKNSHYHRACKGFSINGVKYKRLLGTNGGVKMSTIIFVSDRLADELKRRVDNDRDMSVKFVPAKLEAYKALTCSASIPVSMPHGIVVVDDVETTFKADYRYLTDENDGEPVMTDLFGQDVTIDANDGFGLMSPSLAERWSLELGLDYVVAGLNTRMSFEKGMIYTFDFVDFADKIAGKYTVKDAWGNSVDIREVELVLTTSMLKLWNSYSSCEDYINKSIANGYTFNITKTTPKELENERTLNYQFIQPYNLTDEDINKLIAPTINETKDVLNGDWRKTVLYLKGSGLSSKNILDTDDDYIKAIMVDKRIIDDPFVQTNIYQMIRNKINEAKVGVIKVHGNYSIVSGDPYLLCQNMFGLEKTGILRAGEIYNKYWVDSGAEYVTCYRAPMSCKNNILKRKINRSEQAEYWYKYMNTCTIYNGWDLSMASLNGMDFDGDLNMITDNEVLVGKHEYTPALFCAQRNADKICPAEEDFVAANIASFGNEIGQTTNYITSMYEVRSHFPEDSKEYKMLDYRIQCGQQAQQNVIDKAKGIVAKPMTKEWHDRHAANKIEDNEKREFYRSIVADKKPYFMIYIYPSLMKEYNTYIKNTNKNALREFGITVSELKEMKYENLSERQIEFLKYYDYGMPVGVGNCLMNKICRKFEKEFDGYVGKHNASTSFDYTIMKSDAKYTYNQFSAIKKLYEEYNKRLISYSIFVDYERIDDDESSATFSMLNDSFKKECEMVCPNKEVLCNVILDICYTRSSTKRFAWSMCGEQIIKNLLQKNDGYINYPTLDEDGDFEFCGNRYSVECMKVEDFE